MHYQLQAPVAARDPAGRTSVYGLKIPTIGFVSLHAYACPNVNYEVSLRQDSVTHLFQAAGSWRVPSSLVDTDRLGCQAVSRGSG